MKPAPFLKLCLLAVLLAGCETRDAVPPAPTPVDLTPVNAAAAKVDAAAAKVESAQKGIDGERAKAASKASAAVGAATFANERNPDGPPKQAVAGELGEAGKWLPAPTGEDAAEALRRVNLILTGQRDEARAAYAKSDAERTESNARAAKAETERESALRERDTAKQEARDTVVKIQANADARVDAYRVESEARIRESEAKAKREIDAANAMLLRYIFFPIAGTFAVGAAVIFVLAYLRESKTLYGASAACLGASVVFAAIPFAVGFFLWIAVGVLTLLAGFGVRIFVKAQTAHRTAEELAADNELAAKAFKQVVAGVQNAKLAVPDAAGAVLTHVEDAVGPEVRDFIRRLKSAV